MAHAKPHLGALPPLGLWVYRLIAYILWALSPLIYRARIKKNKEDASRLAERYGFASQARPEGPLVWLHGSSVGESLSMLPLIEKLRAAHIHVLVTTGTRTAAHLMAKRLPKGAIHQYLPLDCYHCIKRFLRHWQPQVTVVLESELWPELFYQTPHLIQANARISDKSYAKYRKALWFYKPILQRVQQAFCQNDITAARLKTLGVNTTHIVPNLKYDTVLPHVPAAMLKQVTSSLAGKAVFVFASTHEGEEELIANLHTELKVAVPHIYTIIVPRHPERGSAIRALLTSRGLVAGRRSQGDALEGTDIYIADTLGEMSLWYMVASYVIMGGSLIEGIGGHNPLEPLKLNKITLCGPHMENFDDMLPQLTRNGVLIQVNDNKSLKHSLMEYLSSSALSDKQQARISSFSATFTGGTALTYAAIKKQLSHART